MSTWLCPSFWSQVTSSEGGPPRRYNCLLWFRVYRTNFNSLHFSLIYRIMNVLHASVQGCGKMGEWIKRVMSSQEDYAHYENDIIIFQKIFLYHGCCYSVTKSWPTLWPHRLQRARVPCLSLSPRVCTNACPLSRWCRPTISSSVSPFSSCHLSFLASGYFPVKSSNDKFGSSHQVAKVLERQLQHQFFQWIFSVDFL